MNCAFCSEPGEVECSAAVRKPILILPAECKVGDIYCSAADRKEYRMVGIEFGTLESIGHAGEPVWIFECVADQTGDARYWQVHCAELDVMAKRLFPCSASACWKHYREIADGVYRCKEHWVVGAEEPVPDSRSLHKKWKGNKVKA